jgi:1-pyrroline-5-carboxylate dehydrogenase
MWRLWAIDFLEFYAREILRWGRDSGDPLPRRVPQTLYLPAQGRSSALELPNAILTGMTTAAVVAGNAVLLKPASDTPLVAWKVFELLEEAGVPAGVLNYVPGSGAEIGDFIVEHPLIRFIAFTGSKEVGLRINQKAAQQAPGQLWIKRTILEMGGKDFIVVDEDADFDFAVTQTVASAFGFQGQKCSACSRAIVHRRLYRRFVDAVVPDEGSSSAAARLEDEHRPVASGGSSRRSRTTSGSAGARRAWEPADLEADRQLRHTDRLLRREAVAPDLQGGDLRARPRDHRGEGLRPRHHPRQRHRVRPDRLVLRARPIPDRGGQASSLLREPLHQPEVHRRLVGVHPFGGFNMSGTGSKGGGRDYLGCSCKPSRFRRSWQQGGASAGEACAGSLHLS